MKKMKKRNQKQEKRIKKMILSTGLFAVLLVASTYAWFIGMQSVSVTAFDVKIAAVDGLALSLDGVKFSENVTINKTNYKTVNTSNNQNVWGDLIPMSSVGIINTTTSKLDLFENLRKKYYEKDNCFIAGSGNAAFPGGLRRQCRGRPQCG